VFRVHRGAVSRAFRADGRDGADRADQQPHRLPGYWLDDVAKGFLLLEAVDRSNVKLHIYHAQIIAGDLRARWRPGRRGSMSTISGR
jgi:hypothetical protein